MSDAAVAYGESNTDPSQGPVINLPSYGDPPPAEPLKITITPPQPAAAPAGSDDKWWLNNPNLAHDQAPAAPTSAPSGAAKSLPDAKKWWLNSPNLAPDTAPPKQETDSVSDSIRAAMMPSSDIAASGMTGLAKGVASAPYALNDLVNLAGKGEGFAFKKLYPMLTGTPLTAEQEAAIDKNMSGLVYGSGDAVRNITNLTGDYEPKTVGGRFAGTIGQVVGGGRTLGAANPVLAAPLKDLAMAGGGSQAAGEFFPDSDAARLAGAMLTHKVPAGVSRVTSAVKSGGSKLGLGAKTLIPNSANASEPFNATEGQMQAAAQNVKNSAVDPNQLTSSIDQGLGQNGGQILPGSKPTMGEVTDDQGISQLQNTMRQKNPEPFQQRSQEQNTARAQTLSDTRGQGDPFTLGDYFSKQLQEKDKHADTVEADLQNQAQSTAAQSGEQMRKIGRYGEVPNENATADTILNAQQVRREAENEAWKPLDPYMQSPADKAPVLKRVQQNLDELDTLGQQELHPVEQKIYEGILNKWPKGDVKFQTLKNIRTAIGDAQREVKAGTQAMRRLQILKNSVDEAIDNTVKGIAAAEEKSVKEGKMSPTDTLAANINAQISKWYAERHVGQRTQISAGGYAGPSVQRQGLSAGRAEAVSRRPGTASNTRERPAAAEGSESLQEQKPVAPRFGKTQQKQYDAARGVTLKNHILNELEQSGVINPDGNINPLKFDKWYNKNKKRLNASPELIKSLQEAKSTAEAAQKMQDELTEYREQRIADRKEFDKSRAAKIMGSDPAVGIARIFSSNNPVKEFSDLVKKFKGDKDAMAGLKAGVAEHILNKVANIEMDESGARVVGKVRNQQQLRNFVKTHKNALREVFGGGQELNNIEAVVADIKRNQQYEARANISGQSNTAKNQMQIMKHQKPSLLGRLMDHGPEMGAAAGHFLGGHLTSGLVGGILTKASNAFRSMGLDTIEKIQLEMMLNPEFGRTMLQKVASDNVPIPVQNRVSHALLKSLIPVKSLVPVESSAAVHDHERKHDAP